MNRHTENQLAVEFAEEGAFAAIGLDEVHIGDAEGSKDGARKARAAAEVDHAGPIGQ